MHCLPMALLRGTATLPFCLQAFTALMQRACQWAAFTKRSFSVLSHMCPQLLDQQQWSCTPLVTRGMPAAARLQPQLHRRPQSQDPLLLGEQQCCTPPVTRGMPAAAGFQPQVKNALKVKIPCCLKGSNAAPHQSPEACLLLQDFNRNFTNDPKVKIPWVRQDLCGPRVLTMEWIDGLRCTDPRAIVSSGINVEEFIRGGVVTGLRQLLEVGGVPGSSHCRQD